jgi:hypothetical protein
MIMMHKNREEAREPIFVKGKLSKFDISQINKGIDSFKTIISESATQRQRAEDELLREAREPSRNSSYTTALIEKIRQETMHIKAAKNEIARYEELLK